MKLSVIDRIIILKSMLPETGTIANIKLMVNIKNKIGYSNEELESFNIFEPYKGVLEIPNVTPEMQSRMIDYQFDTKEIELLKRLSENCNNNGWVTESSLGTIEYILDYNIETTETNDQE